jgi:hypothetical protein
MKRHQISHCLQPGLLPELSIAITQDAKDIETPSTCCPLITPPFMMTLVRSSRVNSWAPPLSCIKTIAH